MYSEGWRAVGAESQGVRPESQVRTIVYDPLYLHRVGRGSIQVL